MMIRPRRLRKTAPLRNLVSAVSLSLGKMIQPYFLTDGANTVEPIMGFTGIQRYGIDAASKKIEADLDRGVKNFLLFGKEKDSSKDAQGNSALDPMGVLPSAITKLKSRFGESLVLFSDVCLCPYTNHGHCGFVEAGQVINDASVNQLAKMALVHAQAGVDFVAPSDMMDGRVSAIRFCLDENGMTDVGILSYTAKYASAYYGPFREALASSPQKFDRSTYQMDFRNRVDALRELDQDLKEGADMVMVKPALAYLDVIHSFKAASTVPVVAYCVSGEYEMVKQMAKAGLADERKLTLENLTAITRAGADILITYSASEIAEKGWL